MNKLVLICLLLVLPVAFSADCDNPLLDALDLDALTSSADQTGLAYCPGLEGDNLCCSAATINTLQETTNTLIMDLIKQVAARDTYLLQLQDATVASATTTKLQALQTKAKAAITKITSDNAGGDAGGSEPDAGSGGSEPDAGSGGSEPDAGSGGSEPDAGSGGSEPDAGSGGSEPDAGSGGSEPDAGSGGSEPDAGSGGSEPDAGSGGSEPDAGSGGSEPDAGSGGSEPDAGSGGSEPDAGTGRRLDFDVEAPQQSNDYTELEEAITPFATVIADMTAAYKAAKDNWTKYQQARATCLNTLIEAQASIYCLACRTDYADSGVSGSDATDAAVALDTTFISQELEDCYPFVSYAIEQNQRIYYNAVMSQVDALSTLMDSIVEDPTQVTADDIASALASGIKTDADKYLPVTQSSCTADACSLISQGFFAHGVLQQKIVANGGQATPSKRRMLASLRMLSGTYDPSDEDNSAGVAVDFPEDPIAYLSAWRQGGLVTCAVALVAILLF